MLNKWSKITIVIALLIGMVFWAIEHKTKSEKVQEEGYRLNKQLENLREAHHELNDHVLKSALYQFYNYDLIIQSDALFVKHANELHGSALYTTQNYPQSQALFQQLLVDHVTQMSDVEVFKRKNGKIKNSFLFLTSSMEHVKSLSRESSQKLLTNITKLVSFKNSMGDEKLETLDLAFLDHQNPNDEMTRVYLNLYKTHFEILRSELPEYIFLINKIIKDEKAQERFLALERMLLCENNAELERLNSEYYALIAFSLTTFLLVIYYILLSEKEKGEILKLQRDYQESVTTDILTGLKNRNGFIDDIKQYGDATVILFDVSDFSAINNLYGIKIGDTALRYLSDKIKTSIVQIERSSVYRVGADQFAVLSPTLNDEASYKIAVNILEAIEQNPCRYDGLEQPIPLPLQVGISSKEPLLVNASLALQSISNDYHKKIGLYNCSLDKTEEIQKNILMIEKIKHALENDQIVMLYQPIIDLKTKAIIKYEALVRLQDNDEYISPYLFLELSKKAKLYAQITHTVIAKSIAASLEYGVDISINLSIEDMLHQETQDFIIDVLDKNDPLGARLTFEILESEEIQDFVTLKAFIQKVKRFGVSIAIDDFGSGYSNYNYLLDLDVDILKIDGSLIKNIDKNDNNRLIVQSIVEFANLANIKTVAEFVNTEQIEVVVSSLGIDFAQGFYYSPPRMLEKL